MNITRPSRSRTILKVFLLLSIVVVGAVMGAGYHHYTTEAPSAPAPVTVTVPPKSVVSSPLPAESSPPTIIDFSIPTSVNGMAPLLTTVKTSQPVVFLGIDDGAYKDPSVIRMMRENRIKASLFLSKVFIADNPRFFADLARETGSKIENHTLSHNTRMSGMPYAYQRSEICGMAEYEQQHYGRRPIFYRPPGGAYDATMLRAAHDCGMRAVVNWVAKANGGSMQYQIGNKLRPGDIVLMHFRPEFARDMRAFIDAMNAAGLRTELLEDAIER